MRLLDAVKEVGELVNPTDLTRVTQRPFDRARERSENFSDCPPARRITEQLSTTWKKTLELAAMNPRGRSTGLSYARAGRDEGWLTEEYVDHALRLVAHRLGIDTLTPVVYWKEAEAMLRADRARSKHGGQLRLPNPDQVERVAGSWDRGLAHAGLRARHGLGGYSRRGTVPTIEEILDRCYEHHGAQPSVHESEVFARANGIPYPRRKKGRSWATTVRAWKKSRRARGLDVPKGPPRRGQHPDYSQDVGAALPGERRGRRRYDRDECVEAVASYLGQLDRGERVNQRNYDAWARDQTGVPWSSVFDRHGGWSALRDAAWERLRG